MDMKFFISPHNIFLILIFNSPLFFIIHFFGCLKNTNNNWLKLYLIEFDGLKIYNSAWSGELMMVVDFIFSLYSSTLRIEKIYIGIFCVLSNGWKM